MPGTKFIKLSDVPEEQIWGKNVKFYEKKLYRDDRIAINMRRRPVQAKTQSEEGYQVHSHGDSMEIKFNIKGKGVGFNEDIGNYDAGEGYVVVIPPNTKHGLVSVEEELVSLVIYLPPPKQRY